MSDNDKCLGKDFGYSLQLTNCIIYSGAMSSMTR